MTQRRRAEGEEQRRAATEDALAALLEASLVAWGHPGEVRRSATDALLVRTAAHAAEIARAAPGAPFRWSVSIGGRQRHASSIPGLLRVLRLALDAGFQPSRIRMAPIGTAP